MRFAGPKTTIFIMSTLVDFTDRQDRKSTAVGTNGIVWSMALTKSDRTRNAILEAARLLFSTRGYDGATIRDVAAEAAIDPAMVIRYFGSKEELFIRAAAIDIRLPALDSLPREEVGEQLVRGFLESTARLAEAA